MASPALGREHGSLLSIDLEVVARRVLHARRHALLAAPRNEPAERLAKKTASAPHMLRIVPQTVPRVGRSYEHFPDGFELHLLQHERE